MARLQILQPGMAMTVQDGGRRGMLRFGVSGAGAMDPEARIMANSLVGNPDEAAALEFAVFGGRLQLDEDRMIAVCGAVQDLKIGGRQVTPWASHLARAGEEIGIGSMQGTVWGYIAIAGGIETPPVLGARSTHLRTKIGGHEGRALEAGDALPLGPVAGEITPRKLAAPWRPRSGPIDVVTGPQAEAFSPETLRLFLSGTFRVTQKRDRMAMVLEGPKLVAEAGHDIISDGTLPGSIQVPGSGQPMVLLADRQTTGGYPKIATVARVDLARLTQMHAGQPLRFRAISQDQAEQLLLKRRAAFTRVLALTRGEDAPPADSERSSDE